MKKNGRTIKEDILIIMRGIREFDKILPKQMAYQVLKSVIAAFTPYLTVVMSAVILNELVGTRNITKLWNCILVSIGAVLLLSCPNRWKIRRIMGNAGAILLLVYKSRRCEPMSLT